MSFPSPLDSYSKVLQSQGALCFHHPPDCPLSAKVLFHHHICLCRGSPVCRSKVSTLPPQMPRLSHRYLTYYTLVTQFLAQDGNSVCEGEFIPSTQICMLQKTQKVISRPDSQNDWPLVPKFKQQQMSPIHLFPQSETIPMLGTETRASANQTTSCHWTSPPALVFRPEHSTHIMPLEPQHLSSGSDQ